MTELHLKGLRANRPSSLLAAIGLYHVLPECKIRYLKDESNCAVFYPAITTDCSVSELLEKIKAKTKDFFPATYRSAGRKFPHSDFMATDTNVGWTFGSDHRLTSNEKKDGNVVSIQPLNMIARQASPYTEFMKALKLLDQQPATLQEELLTDWRAFPRGLVEAIDNFMLFPEGEKASVFETRHRIVPLFVILSVYSWSVLKCHVYSSHAACPGYDYDGNCFYFPICSQPCDKDEYVAWAMHPQLRDVKQHRGAFRNLGLERVVRFPIRPGVNGADNFGPCEFL